MTLERPRRYVFHGGSRTPEYVSWKAMVHRCLSPKSGAFVRYGGRGITVCAEWVRSFTAFRAHIGPRPAGTTLDRIDGTKGYEPGNVRWATTAQQRSNQRTNRRLVFGGRSMTLTEWAREVGITPERLRRRLFRDGWSLARALTEPVNHKRRGT